MLCTIGQLESDEAGKLEGEERASMLTKAVQRLGDGVLIMEELKSGEAADYRTELERVLGMLNVDTA